MKVAFCNRSDYNSPLGGDGVQMIQTKKYLEQLFGLKIEIITNAENLDNSFDLIHVFNFSIPDTTEKFINKALTLKIPIVSSPIYWDYSYSTTETFFKFFKIIKVDEKIINAERKVLKIISFFTKRPYLISRAYQNKIKFFIENSDVILPNSQEELDLLINFSRIKENFSQKAKIVYNANSFKNSSFIDEKAFLQKYKIPKNYVLQVSRIEYVKNQINLLRALKNDREIPVVFVGKITDNKYFNILKKLADIRGNVYFIREVSHEEIVHFYKYASLHVLLSLRESPGLVNLEALSQSCPIVISDFRFTPLNTYFKNQKYIVNPLDIISIKKKILLAREEKIVGFFDKNTFSWERAAEQTYEGYKKIFNN